ADGGARRIAAVHACHGHRALTRSAIVQRNYATTLYAPRNVVFVLAGGDAGIALNATVGIAEELHSRHYYVLRLRRLDLTQRHLAFMHVRHRVIAVGGECVDAFAKYDRVGTRWVPGAQVLALVEAGEVERHPRDALADALGYQRPHSGFCAVLRAQNPHPLPVSDTPLGRI